MDKLVSSKRVALVRAYLNSIGAPIKQSQAYKVVALANGEENENTLAAAGKKGGHKAQRSPIQIVDGKKFIADQEGKLCRFLDITDDPLQPAEMASSDWRLTVVIALSMDAMGDVDAMNEEASKTITGNKVALCDIGYDVFPYFYGPGTVAIKVSGMIEEPAYHVEWTAPLMPEVDLLDLAEQFRKAADGKNTMLVKFDGDEYCRHRVVWIEDSIDESTLILERLHKIKDASDKGESYRATVDGIDLSINFDDALETLIFEHLEYNLEHTEDGHFLQISDVAYGRRSGDAEWNFTNREGLPWFLRFES